MRVLYMGFILTAVFVSGCVNNRAAPAASREELSDVPQLKRACIRAAVCGIESEIKRNRAWLEEKKEKPSNDEELSQIKERLESLENDLHRYETMKEEYYNLPQKLRVISWVENSPSAGSILYVKGMTRSGPWYHICGIRGGNYTALEPGIRYSMSIYPVYPRYYWGMKSYFVYIEEYEKTAE